MVEVVDTEGTARSVPFEMIVEEWTTITGRGLALFGPHVGEGQPGDDLVVENGDGTRHQVVWESHGVALKTDGDGVFGVIVSGAIEIGELQPPVRLIAAGDAKESPARA